MGNRCAGTYETDLFSRQVMGWSLREDMTSNIVIDALRMAWFRPLRYTKVKNSL